MKFLKKSIYALALASMMGLWSCTSDEALPGGETSLKGHSVPVTLTVSRGEAQTRTILSENNATGGLNDVWESGDKLTVYNSEGVRAGELVIGEGVGTDTGVFTGAVTAEDGQQAFNLWYTDPDATGETDSDGKPIYFNSNKEMIVDLSKMPKYTSVEALSAMDVLSKAVTLNIKGNQATLVKDEVMTAHLAMARFSLNGIPTGKTGTLTIRNSASTETTGGNKAILYKERLGLADSENKGTAERAEGIVIENVKAGEDIYLAFIPGTYTLSFHMEFDGVNYDYAFTNSTPLQAGVYYNAFTKAEGAEEGTIDGVNIPLQKEIFAELHLEANFDGANPDEIVIIESFNGENSYTFDLSKPYKTYKDSETSEALPWRDGYTFMGWIPQEGDPIDQATTVYSSSSSTAKAYYIAKWEKNPNASSPLAKWAESDLMNDGKTSGANYKSTFTGAYGTTGDYYQFGRNKGWMNCADIRNQYSKTAVAMMNDNWTGAGQRYTYFWCEEYGTVNTTNLINPYKGVGDATTGNWYNSNTKMANLPEYFIYAGNEGLGNWNGEYVFDSSIRNAHTWAERAKYCGYSNNDPCPEGWRIPKLEDWKKILPKGGHVYSTGATSDFSEISEIKEDGDVKYAIRWNRYQTTNGKQYLKIDALVVPSSVSSTDNINWGDSKVVARYFKGAGAIKPSFFLAQLHAPVYKQIGTRWYPTGEYQDSYQWVAQPQPLCEFNYNYEILQLTNGIAATTKVNILRDDTDLGGFYWVDDVEQYVIGFRFDENNDQQQGSYINVVKLTLPYACNIRCISKD